MGQKVNPISLRLEKTNRHFDSCWYDDYNYTELLLQDLKIKNYFKTVLNQINYPEGRILIENLPKKSNINLFYCNPSNSRRKKKNIFQLQDYKDNKKNKIHKKNTSFFTFPEQKYWNQEKNFTLAHPGLLGWKNEYALTAPLHLYKKNDKVNRVDLFSFPKVEKDVYQKRTELLQLRNLFYSLFDLTQKKNVKIGTENGLSPKGNQLPYSNSVRKTKKDDKKAAPAACAAQLRKGYQEEYQHKQERENNETNEYSKIKQIMESNLGFNWEGLHKSEILKKSFANPSLDKHLVVRGKTICYKEGKGHYNDINKFFLQFISNNNKIDSNKFRGKQNTEKKWVVERFFVRYLLAQLYGKFLQNKSVYSQENLRTLYQFRMFFPEKNNIQKTISTTNYKKYSIHPKDRSLLGLGKQKEKDSTKKAQIKKGHEVSLELLKKDKLWYPLKSSDLCLPGIPGIPGTPGISGIPSFAENKGKEEPSLGLLSEGIHKPPITSLQKIRTVLPSILPSIRGSKKRIIPGLYSSKRVYKSHLESFLSNQYNSFFNLHLFRTLIEKQGALFLVQEIVYYLERKMPFRRIKTQILREIPRYKHIKGVRITCSGRVGGRSKKAQRSKTQSVKIGQTPLGVFSSKIDFASKSALTRFGLIGVKVWVCYQ